VITAKGRVTIGGEKKYVAEGNSGEVEITENRTTPVSISLSAKMEGDNGILSYSKSAFAGWTEAASAGLTVTSLADNQVKGSANLLSAIEAENPGSYSLAPGYYLLVIKAAAARPGQDAETRGASITEVVHVYPNTNTAIPFSKADFNFVPAYSIVFENMVNGSVRSEPSGAIPEGSAVTLFAEGSSGYELAGGSLSAKYGNSVEISLSPVNLSSFIFTMPAGNVIVSARFGRAVTGISISPDNEFFIGPPGFHQKLSAQVLPADAINYSFIWSSSNEDIAEVDQAGNITARAEGNAVISVSAGGKSASTVMIVLPGAADFTITPKADEVDASGLTGYKTSNAGLLAYRFNGPGTVNTGAITGSGIDFRGMRVTINPDSTVSHEWVSTAYNNSGLFYDLNGAQNQMSNGIQAGTNIKLSVVPMLVKEKGIPFIMLIHVIKNTGPARLTNQRFGAAMDLCIGGNNNAPLMLTGYGALMTESNGNAPLVLALYCKSGAGVTPADNLWIGRSSGNTGGSSYTQHVYDYGSGNYTNGVDSAIAFSWQNIGLESGETKIFTVRMTLAEDSGGDLEAVIY